MTDLSLLGHSAVELSDRQQTLVIDPGVFSDLDAIGTADAIVVTHAHADHLAPQAIAGVSAPVYGPAEVVAQLTEAGVPGDRLHAVSVGETFTAAGFSIEVLGGEHAQIYPGLPSAQNNAYLVDGTILHTGDSLPPVTDPGAVRTLLLPVAAPWLKLAEAIDYARAFENAQVLPIHDAILSTGGMQLTDSVLTAILGADTYSRPTPGSSVVLPA